MQIVCPSCATVHTLPEGFLSSTERKVRCISCRKVWGAKLPPEDDSEYSGDFDTGLDQSSVDDMFSNAPVFADPPPEPEEAPAPVAKPAVKKKPAKPARAPRRLGWPAAACAASLVVLLTIFALPEKMVGLFPQMDKLYRLVGIQVNLRGIAIAKVSSKLLKETEGELLVVDGEITNITHKQVPVPPLRFVIRSPAGVEIYSWTAKLDKSTLEPGEGIAFRRRLAAPPAESNEVVVRFATKDDPLQTSGALSNPHTP